MSASGRYLRSLVICVLTCVFWVDTASAQSNNAGCTFELVAGTSRQILRCRALPSLRKMALVLHWWTVIEMVVPMRSDYGARRCCSMLQPAGCRIKIFNGARSQHGTSTSNAAF